LHRVDFFTQDNVGVFTRNVLFGMII